MPLFGSQRAWCVSVSAHFEQIPRPRPLFAAYPEINKIIQDAFDAAIVGGKTPQAALAEAQKKAETALKDYDF